MLYNQRNAVPLIYDGRYVWIMAEQCTPEICGKIREEIEKVDEWKVGE